MQQKSTAEKGTVPNLHVSRGRFIPSMSKTMGLLETADDLGTKTKKQGRLGFCHPQNIQKLLQQ